ncbi:hypothetical protein [Algisphaera agarilytica]|uniref:Uncharacterized protein n=1 Tax=Algisphaera agarilytica TaxID=1385975 RepID=A0A7X0H3Z7_9BACT|nr:hypothetical protein [Algisphaera agarilytica]MBB6428846.1 hypothetical protein [Algisphaera agarilytica]
MPKVVPILIAAIVLFQALLGNTAGVICFGGGHEHPDDDIVQACELDCSHASNNALLPVPVEESHSECGCIDIDFSISELLTVPPRVESSFPTALVFETVDLVLVRSLHFRPIGFLPQMPSWFDPGGMQRVEHISTTRLIV